MRAWTGNKRNKPRPIVHRRLEINVGVMKDLDGFGWGTFQDRRNTKACNDPAKVMGVKYRLSPFLIGWDSVDSRPNDNDIRRLEKPIIGPGLDLTGC